MSGPPPIGMDLPLHKFDFTKPVNELTQIRSEDNLKIYMYYIIKHNNSSIYSEIKDYIGQYLGKIDHNFIWLLLYEKDPSDPSKWKPIENTKMNQLLKWNIENIMNTLGKDISEDEKLKLQEAQQHFNLENEYLYSNLVMIDDIYDIFAKEKTQDTIERFGEIAFYELGYGGDDISATVSPDMLSEIGLLIDHLGYEVKPPLTHGNTPIETVRKLKEQKENTTQKLLPDGVRNNIFEFTFGDPKDRRGGKTTRKIKPRICHRTRKPKHSRRYKRRGNQRKSRRRV